MFRPKQHQHNRIALISVDGDPAAEIGQEEAGGQNVYVRQVGEMLAQQGWQVDMLTRRSHPEQDAVIPHSPNCRTIRLACGPAQFVSRDELFQYLPRFVHQIQQFQQDEDLQYDLIHTHYWLSAWVGMRLKRQQPLIQVHTYHSLGAVKYQTIDQLPTIAGKRLSVEKNCLETVDRVVATSPQEQEHLQILVSKQGQIDVIPCGTDLRRFGSVSRQEARQMLGIAANDKIVLYVGRFDPRKGIETLVRAFSGSKLQGQIPMKLIIGGGSCPGRSDGVERDRIAAIVAELGLQDQVIFPGRLDAELPLYYAAADVCVVPSHYEPFGLVAIEAMASYTPVVASRVGGLQFTVLPHVTGFLATPKDEIAFAKAIDQVLANPTLRDELGRNGRQRVEASFSWQAVASDLSDLYSKLLSPARTKTRAKSLAA
jgi:D-inositol-3-phosphate glycosyltransferase